MQDQDSLESKRAWKEIKEMLKKKLSQLTNSNSIFPEGKQDEIIEKLRIKLGKTKEEIKKIISDL
ncbi:MAG: general stress protein CsbD [Bacteroidota bacterium]|nr:general stress protein CsbD [Bacteroidota bacterium]